MNLSEFKLNLALVIAINDYQNGIPALGTARQDAEAIAIIAANNEMVAKLELLQINYML